MARRRPTRKRALEVGVRGDNSGTGSQERARRALELGIDFGTTRTVVACADRGNHPVVGFHDAAGDTVAVDPDDRRRAGRRAALRPRRCGRERRRSRRPVLQAVPLGGGHARTARARGVGRDRAGRPRRRLPRPRARRARHPLRRAPRRREQHRERRAAGGGRRARQRPRRAAPRHARRLPPRRLRVRRDAQRALGRGLRVHAPPPRHPLVPARARRASTTSAAARSTPRSSA